MEIKRIKVLKDGVIKEIDEKDVKNYVAVGWTVYEEHANPFKTTYSNAYIEAFKK